MMRGIDISNWQAGLNINDVAGFTDFCIMKATGGLGFTDVYCDDWVVQCRDLGIPFGFYHYAHDGYNVGTGAQEATRFLSECRGYFGFGIPILDWEEDSVDAYWVNEFVWTVYNATGVWCWIYANPWRFNQYAPGGIEPNCSRWIAAYPTSAGVTLDTDPGEIPATDGDVCCWQYSSNGYVGDYSGRLDVNHFYGDAKAWTDYIYGPHGDRPHSDIEAAIEKFIVENDVYKVTVEKKQ